MKIRYIECDKPQLIIRNYKQIILKIKNNNYLCSLYDDVLNIIDEYKLYIWYSDIFINYAVILLHLNKYKESINIWERAAHCYLSSIAIYIKIDIITAERKLNEITQKEYFIKIEDFNLCDYLIRGIKNNDSLLIKKAQKNIIIQFLNPEIVKIILSFKENEDEEDDLR